MMMRQESLEKTVLSPFALLTAEDTAKMDQAAGDHLDSLMENAGRACADVFCEHVSSENSVLIAVGAGNNGGDGYVMAHYLKERGYQVAVAAWQPPKTELAQKASKRWAFEGKMVDFSVAEAGKYAWVIDGIFGAGFSSERLLPLEISTFFKAAKNLLAIDVPSGVASNDGKLCGDVADYDLTVTFTRKRPAHLLSPASRKCGFVEVREIGIPLEALSAVDVKIFYNQPGLWHLPLQAVGNGYNKYSRGVVSIVSGALMPGAACLSAEGARRSGAGIVRVASPKEALLPLFLRTPGLIVDLEPLEVLLQNPKSNVWVCGPGLTKEEASEAFQYFSSADVHLIADAGLLGMASGNPSCLKGVSLLTPHEGEFSRLFGTEGTFNLRENEGSRMVAALAGARLLNAVLLLKGEETIIASPDGRVAINTHATPALATAGSGDVLSGVAGTCLASGLEVWEAACAAAWLHGEAGRRAAKKEGGWPIAEDVARELGHARQAAEEAHRSR
ncbi:NAD(P)H-hydrate dehydratase [Acetobacteraceae bacterium]|nr:NAD(P)H-hydrate dehydratase [Acetobacteraceae bacterium]